MTFYSDMPEFRFGDGSAVTFSCPPDAVQRLVSHIRDRVEGANRMYNTNVLPKLRAEEEQRAKQAAENTAEAERLQAEAQQRIDEIS